MLQDELLRQGLELMLYGMGTVIIFLTLLVLATQLMSSLLTRFSPATPDSPPEASAAPPDSQLLAVIAAAIHKHRSRQDS